MLRQMIDIRMIAMSMQTAFAYAYIHMWYPRVLDVSSM
jgi:hypothetical protein